MIYTLQTRYSLVTHDLEGVNHKKLTNWKASFHESYWTNQPAHGIPFNGNPQIRIQRDVCTYVQTHCL